MSLIHGTEDASTLLSHMATSSLGTTAAPTPCWGSFTTYKAEVNRGFEAVSQHGGMTQSTWQSPVAVPNKMKTKTH
jgi:hypothetical protein